MIAQASEKGPPGRDLNPHVRAPCHFAQSWFSSSSTPTYPPTVRLATTTLPRRHKESPSVVAHNFNTLAHVIDAQGQGLG